MLFSIICWWVLFYQHMLLRAPAEFYRHLKFLEIFKKEMLLKTTFVAEFQQHLLFLATMLLKYHHINLCPSDPPLHDMRAIYPKKLRFLELVTRFQALARAWHALVTNLGSSTYWCCTMPNFRSVRIFQSNLPEIGQN